MAGDRAASFKQAVALLRQAGRRLAEQGYTPQQRVRVLRGLYYGSRHSLDYERRGSRLRNLGFNFYLKALPPPDPARLVGPALARALKDAAVLREGGRSLDVGHVVIGLDARRNAFIRRWPIPTQGGSGLELATWLGDLGGAAGLLALERVTKPRARVRALLFNPKAYDLRPNLEGDMAGYLVARPRGERRGAPLLRPEATLADALQAYWERDWDDRFQRFAPLIGARLRGGRLADAAGLQRRVQGKVRRFAASYVLARLWQQRQLSRAALRGAGAHLGGAADEVSTLFVAWLQAGLKGGRRAALPDLAPSAPQEPRGWLAWAGWGRHRR